MRLQNLHTHSVLCDGADTLEEMTLAAIEKNFYSIGFSGHSYVEGADYTMTEEQTAFYRSNVSELKKKYADRIKLFCGLEADIFTNTDLSGYDYLIGSVHYVDVCGRKYDVDESPERTEEVINEYFGGDGLKYAGAYFSLVAELYKYGSFDIIGHFDLITKFSEKKPLFDTEAKEYKMSAYEAAAALKGKIPFFEVNTGAIARGWRSRPYPDSFILKELKELGFGAVVASDCHNKNMLDCGFLAAREILKENGFNEIYILTENGFEGEKL